MGLQMEGQSRGIELLSLPKRVGNHKPTKVGAGLPINSLPGWEHIPLNSKLPMLKYPGREVIFSKDKIGNSFKSKKQEFDHFGRDTYPGYNALHDSNLKTFYSNESNLKRLRENGEITITNDVICNLKDFNTFRQQLHKSQLYEILRDLNRKEAEQRDRMLILNAEVITNRDYNNLIQREHSPAEVLLRRQHFDEQRALRFKKLYEKSEERFQRIAKFHEMQEAWLESKKMLNQMKMEAHWDNRSDQLRKRLISLKKLFKFKKERYQRNMRNLDNSKIRMKSNTGQDHWDKRLAERISNQKKIEIVIKETNSRKREFCQLHHYKYTVKWDNIQAQIRQRAHSNHKITKRLLFGTKKRKVKKPASVVTKETMLVQDYKENFEKLLDHELCDALFTALAMEDAKINFDPDDPIYKAAKFILQHIILDFDCDLSCNRQLFRKTAERISKYFDEAVSFVMHRATRIIASIRESMTNKGNELNKKSSKCSICPEKFSKRYSLPKLVSFNGIANTIGMSSYSIHQNQDIRLSALRTPTPPGSLASINVHSNENGAEKPTITRRDKIFVEHFIIKFRRALIVGMGKRVFTAIQCHFQGKIMDVRKEMLDLDKNFLVRQVTKSILRYARNSLDYESSTKLVISALSSEIVWNLQKHLLRPNRDPRGIVLPRFSCRGLDDNGKLCIYCQ